MVVTIEELFGEEGLTLKRRFLQGKLVSLIKPVITCLLFSQNQRDLLTGREV